MSRSHRRVAAPPGRAATRSRRPRPRGGDRDRRHRHPGDLLYQRPHRLDGHPHRRHRPQRDEGRPRLHLRGRPRPEQAAVLAAQKAMDQALPAIRSGAGCGRPGLRRARLPPGPPTSGPTSTTSTTSTTTPSTESLDACRTALAAQREAQAEVAAAQRYARHGGESAGCLDTGPRRRRAAMPRAPVRPDRARLRAPAGSTSSGGPSSGPTATRFRTVLRTAHRLPEGGGRGRRSGDRRRAGARPGEYVSPIAGTVATVPVAGRRRHKHHYYLQPGHRGRGQGRLRGNDARGGRRRSRPGGRQGRLRHPPTVPSARCTDRSWRSGCRAQRPASGTVYPVTVGLPDTTATADLGNGATASVSITTERPRTGRSRCPPRR